jgi:hypothetical protein
MPPVHKYKTSRIEVHGHSDILHAEHPVYKFCQSTPPRRPKPPNNMIGLLTLAGIPTTIAVAEGISERQNKRDPTSPLQEARQMRKFNIRCYCAGSSPGKKDIHNGKLIVGDGNVYIKSPQKKIPLQEPLIEAESFYVEYPDPERTPAVLGLVTKARVDPPLLNWIYVDEKTTQLRHANRSGSIDHWVGDFGSTDGFEDPEENEEDEPTGVTFDDKERFVAVQPRKGSAQEQEGLWEVWWDEHDNKLENGKKVDGRLVLRVNLERDFIEEEGA